MAGKKIKKVIRPEVAAIQAFQRNGRGGVGEPSEEVIRLRIDERTLRGSLQNLKRVKLVVGSCLGQQRLVRTLLHNLAAF